MPHPRKQPVSESEMECASEKEMEESRYFGHHTICQTIREIYHMSKDPELKLKCRLAMAMAKSMNDKMHQYKNKYEPDLKHVITE